MSDKREEEADRGTQGLMLVVFKGCLLSTVNKGEGNRVGEGTVLARSPIMVDVNKLPTRSRRFP